MVHNTAYSDIAQDYERAIQVLKSLPGDIFLGAHAMYFDLKKKYDLLDKSPTNPFIDREGYKKHIAQKEKEFYKELEKQKSEAL